MKIKVLSNILERFLHSFSVTIKSLAQTSSDSFRVVLMSESYLRKEVMKVTGAILLVCICSNDVVSLTR